MLAKLLIGFLMIAAARGLLEPQGAKCGQKRCGTVEYCSPYDSHCRPCSEACDTQSHNYQPRECAKDCQEYLHDQRYVLRAELDQYDDLRGEVQRLRIISIVSITLTCVAVLVIIYLLARSFLSWQKFSKAFRGSFTKTWVKKTTTANGGTGGKNNKVQDDPELGVAKQNGLKLSMPTISGSVSASKSTVNGNGTPNTTSTPLSRRHPSEDTTLDYAYDNPAMTPSPEAAQLRTKRESSF